MEFSFRPSTITDRKRWVRDGVLYRAATLLDFLPRPEILTLSGPTDEEIRAIRRIMSRAHLGVCEINPKAVRIARKAGVDEILYGDIRNLSADKRYDFINFDGCSKITAEFLDRVRVVAAHALYVMAVSTTARDTIPAFPRVHIPAVAGWRARPGMSLADALALENRRARVETIAGAAPHMHLNAAFFYQGGAGARSRSRFAYGPMMLTTLWACVPTDDPLVVEVRGDTLATIEVRHCPRQ